MNASWRSQLGTTLDESQLKGSKKLSTQAERRLIRNILGYGQGLQSATTIISKEECYGSAIHATDKFGRTPLHIVSDYGWGDAIQMLISHGADPTICDKNKNTSLHIAVKSVDDTEALELLVAAIDFKDSCGNTALHIACLHRNLTAVRVQLGSEANPFLINDEGKTAEDYAKLMEQNEILQLLNPTITYHCSGMACVLVSSIIVIYGIQLHQRKVVFEVEGVSLPRNWRRAPRGSIISPVSTASYASRPSVILGDGAGRRRGLTEIELPSTPPPDTPIGLRSPSSTASRSVILGR